MNLKDEQQTLFYDILINFYSNNPALYDKSDSKYAFPFEKNEKLKILSHYLQELGIHISVPEIASAWEQLVTKFKKCLADENAAGSGSAAKHHNFPYYEHLIFLKSAVQHRPALSTMSLNRLSTPEISRSDSMSSYSYSDVAPKLFGPSIQPPSVQRLIRPMKVPPYDEPAKKYMKLMDKENESVSIVGQKIVETLDKVNQTIHESNIKKSTNNLLRESNQMHHNHKETSTSIDYSNYLKEALSKVPVGRETECMEYVLQTLEEHDK